MAVILLPLLEVIDIVIDLFTYVLIASIIISWLVNFNVLNTRNHLVYTIVNIVERLTDPVLRPIRNILPSFGGLDLSPIVVFLGLRFLQSVLHQTAMRLL